MNFTRLIVNGCSFTYGDELDDPFNQCWGKLTADKLGIPFTNLASPGAGNDRVLRTTLDHLYQSTEPHPLYVIAFSYAVRREEYFLEKADYEIIDFGTVSDTVLERFMISNCDPVMYAHKKLHYWLSVVNTFKANNIPYLVTDYIPDETEVDIELRELYPDLYHAVHSDPHQIGNFLEITNNYPKLPGGHEGPEAQLTISEYLYTEIEKRWH